MAGYWKTFELTPIGHAQKLFIHHRDVRSPAPRALVQLQRPRHSAHVDAVGGRLYAARCGLVFGRLLAGTPSSALAARGESGDGIRPALHPRRLRCSSFKYAQYFQSSRLVGGAHHRSRCSPPLPPRAASPLLSRSKALRRFDLRGRRPHRLGHERPDQQAHARGQGRADDGKAVRP